MNGHKIRILHDSETKEDVLKDIISQTKEEDSFMVLELDDIVRKVERWRRLLPRVDLFYAVKCNPERAIINTLVSLGCGFDDCASKSEIRCVLDAGAKSSHVVFANTVKRISHLHYAAKNGVELLTFDNLDELHKIKENYPRAKLLLRFRCDDKDATYSLGNKFGAEPDETGNLLREAKGLDLDLVGVAFHVGSMCKRPSVYAEAITTARKIFDEAVTLGFSPYLLDIGGGFSGGRNNNFEEIAEVVNHQFDFHFPDDGITKVGDAGYCWPIIAEPGRYVVGSSCSLATQVTGKRKKKDPSGQWEIMEYYINDGKHGCFFEVIESLPVPLSCGAKKREEVPTTIFGQTCCGEDVVCKDVTLPVMQTGEWLMWEDMGAYTVSMTTNFNGFKPAKVILTMSTELLLYYMRKDLESGYHSPGKEHLANPVITRPARYHYTNRRLKQENVLPDVLRNQNLWYTTLMWYDSSGMTDGSSWAVSSFVGALDRGNWRQGVSKATRFPGVCPQLMMVMVFQFAPSSIHRKDFDSETTTFSAPS
ncbi:ornithine decarboxylase-like [Oratosquilla oratoria]|uniref:ornithine decarboxylase-like n=1 Tax=Oratosquilla oratoria TaxID=337810 RepID=UPI003F75AA1A